MKDVIPQLDNLPKVQFQETIQLLSSLSFQLMETDTQQPFQFVVISSKDFSSLSSERVNNKLVNAKFSCCGNNYIFNHNKTPNFNLRGEFDLGWSSTWLQTPCLLTCALYLNVHKALSCLFGRMMQHSRTCLLPMMLEPLKNLLPMDLVNGDVLLVLA